MDTMVSDRVPDIAWDLGPGMMNIYEEVWKTD